MKKCVKQLIAVLLSLTFMMIIVSCDGPYGAVYMGMEISPYTEDKIEVQMSNLDDGWEMDFDNGSNNDVVVFDGDKSIYDVTFMDELTMNSYIELLEYDIQKEMIKVEFLENAKENGIAYTMYIVEKDKFNVHYEVIGWIIGSNTGIVAKSYESKESMDYIMDCITLEIMETKQRDGKYYYGVVDNIEEMLK
jgi:hypothetical protein